MNGAQVVQVVPLAAVTPGADGLVVEFAAEQQRVAGRVWTWVALVDDQDERRFLITIRVVGCEAWPQGPVSKQASSSSK